jgi:hypothetical protein
MTARSSGKAKRVHHPRTAVRDRVAGSDPQNAGKSFDITAYVKASRRAQRLPENVDNPAVLERLIALLHVAELEKRQK